jgi:hypothetical protein
MMRPEKIVDRAMDILIKEYTLDDTLCHICRNGPVEMETFEIAFGTDKKPYVVTITASICTKCHESILESIEQTDEARQRTVCKDTGDKHVWVWDDKYNEWYCDRCAVWALDQL